MENRVAGAQARQASPRSSTAVRFLPGPWKLGEVRLPGGVRWDAIVRGPNGEPICSALMAGYSNKQGQANAHLIAAAPEMYKALKAARLYVECCTEPNTPAEKALAVMNRHTAEARPALNPYDARLERAQMKLIRSIANFHPTRVFGSRADKADCDNAAYDILTFADMCDEFMRAYGEYMAAHSVSITPKDITECFASPFRDAIDGNATYVLRKAGEELAEAGRDGARADYQRSFARAG